MRALLEQINAAREARDYTTVWKLLERIRIMVGGEPAAADPIARRLAEDEAGARMADESHDGIFA